MQIYVLDTNVVIDYIDVLPGDEENNLEEPTVDLSSAHLVIPTAVVRELSSFKKEHSDRGKVARLALKRIRELFKDVHAEMEDFYSLKETSSVSYKQQIFSILPISHNFTESSPYVPSDDDMDGQIILAALSAKKAMEYRKNFINARQIDGVTLLTNDNGLAIRATARGISTSRFSYKYPAPYTGRRDLLVPDELFAKFWNSSKISIEEWNQSMPKESKLMANEFIIMRAERYPRDYDSTNNPHFGHIARYDATTESLVHLKYVINFPGHIKNSGQAIYAEALMNPEIPVVICTGPAGTGKTYLATCYSLNACRNGEYIGVAVVPCQVEDTVGFLPGDLREKMDPHVQPIKNALQNYLLKNDKDFKKRFENFKKYGGSQNCPKTGEKGSNIQAQKSLKEQLINSVDLLYDNWFGEPIPVEYARGHDFPYQIAFYDEFQDQNFRQADTLLKRLGEGGKVIITGDIEQVHSAYLDRENNGIVYASRLLEDNPMVARVTFTEDEVVRHPLVKAIAMRQKVLS